MASSHVTVLTTSMKLRINRGGGGNVCLSRMACLHSSFPPSCIALTAVNGSFKFGRASRVWFHGFVSAKERPRDKSLAAVNQCSSIGFKSSVSLHQLMIHLSAYNVQDPQWALSSIISFDGINFRAGKWFWQIGQTLVYTVCSQAIHWVLSSQLILPVVKRVCNLRDYLKDMLFILSKLFSKPPLKIGELRSNVTTAA